LLSAFSIAYAQLNMELLSQVAYDTTLSDVWGWTDPNTGTEYAIAGLQDGVSIVSLQDPEHAVEVAFAPGAGSNWRDIKTWDHYAYITNETGGGLMVIDLSNLPESAPFTEWTFSINGVDSLKACHNLYIDEFGFCYLVGCDLNNGGAVILNVDRPNGEPEFIAYGPDIYAHDAYVVSNKMYLSEITEGDMAIYDVTDKQQIQELGRQPTPIRYTHNIWLNDDETIAFTTEERPNAPVTAYDITELDNIQELDQYRSVGSLGSGVIPHNVHVWNEYLLVSYYTDGGKIVDASRPENLIEVGNFDTWLGSDGGFNGAWGMYPFFPSQTVVVTDIQNGLYVLKPNYVRACWLEGIVTDSLTGANLSGVTVEIDSTQPNFAETDVFGQFKTGQALSGTFEVTFQKPGYFPKTISVELQNGVLQYLEIKLVPLPRFEITGTTLDDKECPVGNVEIQLTGKDFNYQTTSDENGNFVVEQVYLGDYGLAAGKWGYLHTYQPIFNVQKDTEADLQMKKGYQDDFYRDFGWAVSKSEEEGSGIWERVVPAEVREDKTGLLSPAADVEHDIGEQCFVTDNQAEGAITADVDNGSVTLSSPVMALKNYKDPVLSFHYWFVRSLEDSFTASISNGHTTVEILNQQESLNQWRKVEGVHLAELIELTDSMQLVVELSDTSPGVSTEEGGLDAFLIEEQGAYLEADETAAIRAIAFPNPFNDQIKIIYALPPGTENQVTMQLSNSAGQLILQQQLEACEDMLTFGSQLPNGLYIISFMQDGKYIQSLPVIKMK